MELNEGLLVVDGMMIVLIHHLLKVKMIVDVHDVVGAATMGREDTREEMMITNSVGRITLEVEALFTTSKVQIERQIIDDNQNER